jgi:DNA-directed RNA polymerase subunit H (RpoH/RPB5)
MTQDTCSFPKYKSISKEEYNKIINMLKKQLPKIYHPRLS